MAGQPWRHRNRWSAAQIAEHVELAVAGSPYVALGAICPTGGVMGFRESRFYGSRVGKAKAERGWLPTDEFLALGRQEFRDYRNHRWRGFGGSPPGGRRPRAGGPTPMSA